MSDEEVLPNPDPSIESIARELSQLSPQDRALVMALVARLRDLPGPDDGGYPPDVAFMDFDV